MTTNEEKIEQLNDQSKRINLAFDTIRDLVVRRICPLEHDLKDHKSNPTGHLF